MTTYKPVEEVARAFRHNVGFLQPIWKLNETARDAYGRHMTRTILNELRRRGYITTECLEAMEAEAKGNAA